MDRFAPSEMEIVDTFTHAIFSGGEALSPREVSILETLCQVDDNAAHCVGEQATGNLGRYLRDLGVKEMIQLVARVRERYQAQEPPPAQQRSPSSRSQPSRF